jgi:hypothetical protein
LDERGAVDDGSSLRPPRRVVVREAGALPAIERILQSEREQSPQICGGFRHVRPRDSGEKYTSERRVPNSPANPLPTTIYSLKFRCREIGQIMFKELICGRSLTLRWSAPRADEHFFPAVREIRCKVSCRPTPSHRRPGTAVRCKLTIEDRLNRKMTGNSTAMRHPAIPPAAGNP